MRKVYILGACRTPIGKMGGTHSTLSATELGLIVIKESVNRAGIKPEDVDHVYIGGVIQARIGQNVSGQVSIKAGLQVTTTAEIINVVCGLGLDCVNSAARMIQWGDADIVAAGGMESMSNAPYVLKQVRSGYRMGNAPMVDTIVNDALRDSFNDYYMGITVENVCEQWNSTREVLDEFAADSQNKVVEAIEAGKFMDEIVPVEVNQKKQTVIIDIDYGPRSGTTVESFARLKPVLKADGVVTAGNASGINHGAAALILVSEDKVKELGLISMAEWVGESPGGFDSSIIGVGPVESTKKLFARLDMTIDSIDLIEANEAFAA